MCRVWIGARGGTRTPDAHLRTVALYPLSYTGMIAEFDSDDHPSTHHADRHRASGAGHEVVCVPRERSYSDTL